MLKSPPDVICHIPQLIYNFMLLFIIVTICHTIIQNTQIAEWAINSNKHCFTALYFSLNSTKVTCISHKENDKLKILIEGQRMLQLLHLDNIVSSDRHSEEE